MAKLTTSKENILLSNGIIRKPLKFKKNKEQGERFNNVSCEYDGLKFDSIKEMKRYQYLSILQKNGKINDLKCQVKFELLPKTKICGQLQRKVVYIADFTYVLNSTGVFIVEDAKGAITDVYTIKRKLMFVMLGIEVREV